MLSSEYSVGDLVLCSVLVSLRLWCVVGLSLMYLVLFLIFRLCMCCSCWFCVVVV